MFSVDQKWLVTIKNAPAVRYSSGDTYAADKKPTSSKVLLEAFGYQPTHTSSSVSVIQM